MRRAVLRRREFLASASLSVLALAACAATPESAASFDTGDVPALERMARLLYPHDALGDDVYAEVVAGMVAANPSGLAGGVALLDAQGQGAWIDRAEAEQIAALQAIEGAPFFATMRGGVQAALYEHPAAWAMLGYPGPALSFGGYVDKGFDDIDWLPA